MSLADCQKCWDALCSCGWEYRRWSQEDLNDLILVLTRAVEYKKEHPDATFSSFGQKETKDDQEYMKKVRER